MRTMALLTLMLALPGVEFGQSGRIDPVLARMVPGGAASLFGARMDQLRSTPLYQKMVAQKKLPQLDDFAAQTGFDPRTDVREMLIAWDGRTRSAVLMARGAFKMMAANPAMTQLSKTEYHGYTIYGRENGGFCLLDGTTAVAGTLDQVHASLDQYKSGSRSATAALLARAQAVPGQYQAWAVSTGGAEFLANNMPSEGMGANFAKIFRSLENATFEADLRTGLNFFAQGNCKAEADAVNLRDTAKGLVGFGRLSVPENEPELLRLWDGFEVQQNQKQVTITAKISQDLIDKLVQMLSTAAASGPHSHLQIH